ncbi:ADP-polyphosphate phosphotransferase [Chlorobium sp.]|uniref:ADP-polyphosphate phosphotransferase n=1 Tax=Chlorobium sp. TaxID=1095 RepID=UPI002F40EBF8
MLEAALHMDINHNDYLVREGQKVDLDRFPALESPRYSSKSEYREKLEAQVRKLSDIQEAHYADNRYAVLLIFQAMDAAGKDSMIRHVMSGINPQGCQVFSFKHPSPEELDHDFLWRSNCSLPERGRIGIFNRSYYEEVLIVRVHPEILRHQRIPEAHLRNGDVWKERYRSINDLERHLYRNGTRILKFFLHLSKEEQRRRFLERIDKPEKNWKFSKADIDERKYWDDYMNAYEHCLEATSTAHAPWYVIPADDRKNARLLVSNIILDMFSSLDVRFPETGEERKRELQECRRLLEGED